MGEWLDGCVGGWGRGGRGVKKTRLKTKIDNMGSTHHSIGLCLTEEGVIGPFRYFPGWVVGGWGKSTI